MLRRFPQSRPSGLSKLTRPSVLVAFIVALLAALTALQYRWIGELSSFQRDRMERTLRASTDRFVRDLEREFERLSYVLNVPREQRASEEIVEDHTEWVESTEFPRLIAEMYWVRDQGVRRANGLDERLAIERIAVDDGSFESVPWPPSLRALQQPLARSADAHRGRSLHRSDSFTMRLDDGSIAFVVAQTRLDTKSWAIAVLRDEVLTGELVPALMRHHFGADDGRDYDLVITDSAQPGKPFYSSSAGELSMTGDAADYKRSFREFGGVLLDRDGGETRSLAIEVRHRAGSVDTAVARLRRRNLAFSFGVVMVLAAGVAVLGIAARRARRLAQRQMEFVAGVSHELRTPIAGISSLSQNLADGVVQDLDHAARYGQTIHKESRRLGNMVEGVLHFSAIRSGRYRYEMDEVDLRTVIHEALDALDASLVDKVGLDVDVAEGLPILHGDERALRTVVRNLVSNAMKFSRAGGTARLTAAVASSRRGQQIELSVQDSGPGIDADEASHLFEPFFRGRAAQEQQVEGSGLGLSLVKEIVDAHDGRIEVASTPGEGSTFRIYLPVTGAPDAARQRPRPLGTEGLQGAGDGMDST